MESLYQNITSEMVLIEGGVAPIGDLWNDGEKDETPVMEKVFSAFYLGRYMVPNHSYCSFLNETVADIHTFKNEYIDYRQPAYPHALYHDGRQFCCRESYEWYPVTFVSWVGAKAYCQWLAELSGQPIRLPSEDEWQFAAMTKNRYKWSLGNEFSTAMYTAGKESPSPVNEGTPAENGLYHMTGNVFEWCEDEYYFSLERKPEERLPQMRVIKGGPYNFSFSENFTNSKKFSAYQYSCLDNIGFRIALSK